jgi:hypothetical protein
VYVYLVLVDSVKVLLVSYSDIVSGVFFEVINML